MYPEELCEPTFIFLSPSPAATLTFFTGSPVPSRVGTENEPLPMPAFGPVGQSRALLSPPLWLEPRVRRFSWHARLWGKTEWLLLSVNRALSLSIKKTKTIRPANPTVSIGGGGTIRASRSGARVAFRIRAPEPFGKQNVNKRHSQGERRFLGPLPAKMIFN